MNVSNAAYNKPLTTIVPGLQREGYDPDRSIEDAWYAPEEKVSPRKYHKYAQASLKEKLYCVDEDEENGGDEEPVTPVEPEQPTEPETPEEPPQTEP